MEQLCDTQEPNDSNSVSNQIPAVSGHRAKTHWPASVFATDAYLHNEFPGSGGEWSIRIYPEIFAQFADKVC